MHSMLRTWYSNQAFMPVQLIIVCTCQKQHAILKMIQEDSQVTYCQLFGPLCVRKLALLLKRQNALILPVQ